MRRSLSIEVKSITMIKQNNNSIVFARQSKVVSSGRIQSIARNGFGAPDEVGT